MRKSRALTVFTVLFATSAAAETTTLPDVVVTATRLPTKPEDVAAGVSVITRADMETHGYDSLSQALANVPGLHVSPSGGFGGQTSVFIRGTNSNHVLVLRDGMPVNDAGETTGAYNFGTDTLSDIDRIEVVRGPMAAVYGSGAIGGVINLISRRGTEQGVHWSGDLAGGYPSLLRGAVTASGAEGPVDFALTAESQSRRGFDAIPRRESVYTGVPQGFRDRIMTLNLGVTPVEGTRLSVLLRAQTANFGFNTLGYPTFDHSNSDGQTASLLGRIGGTTHLFGDRLESSVFVGRLQDDRRYLEALNVADPNQTATDDRYHGYRTDAQWNNTLKLGDWSILSGSAATFGYEYTSDSVHVRTNDNYGGYGFGQTASASMSGNAAYAGFRTTVAKRLELSGQVRRDWELGQTPSTWRLGGVYNVSEIATRLKLSYGTGFRAPSLFDRYGVNSYGYVGNPHLRPERAAGWEAGFTTDVPGAGRVDFVSAGATYFDQRVRDLIAGVYSPVNTEINLGSAHVHGVETEAAIRPARWLDIRAAWTLLNTVSVGQPASEGSRLLRRPQHQGSLDATLRPVEDLRIVASFIYTGSAHDYLYNNSGNGTGYGIGQHGTVANIAVNYKIQPGVEVYANGWNVFGSRFEPVNGFAMPGPTALAGVRIGL